MKKIKILCVGKIKEKFIDLGIDEYKKRLSRFCDLKIVELSDERGDVAVKKESDALLKSMSGRVVLMDVEGKLVTSPQLSELIENSYLTSPEVTFVIGGSEGVDERVKARADERISFGRVTYPHQLMRLILTEQIYRAFCISCGTPYHK